MALVKDQNSYVTVLEADEYFSTRLHSEIWDSADVATKEKALVTSTKLIDNQNFLGTATGTFLSFPRNCVYFDPRSGQEVVLEAETPVNILTAVKEYAIYLLSNEEALNPSQSVRSLVIEEIELIDISTFESMPANVYKLLRPLLSSGSHVWWRAN